MAAVAKPINTFSEMEINTELFHKFLKELGAAVSQDIAAKPTSTKNYVLPKECLPSEFDGKNKLQFRVWANKLRLHLKQHSTKMTNDLLSYIEKQSEPVTLVMLKGLDGHAEEHVELNSIMYSVLATKTSDAPCICLSTMSKRTTGSKLGEFYAGNSARRPC